MRGLVLAAAAVMVAAAGCSASGPSGSTGTDPGPSTATGSGGSSPPTASSPGGTPAATGTAVEVCDGDSLRGPADPPSGAVVVGTGQDLSEVVAASPPGTTFWLEPGVHALGPGQYAQVSPHDGDTFVGAPGAVLDGGRRNAYAFGGHARGVTISHLTVRGFGADGDNHNEGVVNHDSASGWSLLSSTVERNAGAGVMIGSQNRLIGNCLRDNGQYGFNAYHADGVRDVELRANEISGNNTDDWEARREGCGCTGGGKFWETVGAQVVGNHVHDNHGTGLWADTNNSGFLFQANHVVDNDGVGIFYETSYNARIVDNVLVRNGLVQGPTNPGFPTAAVYLSEAGSDPRVGGPYGDVLLVAGNVFQDNWSGVVAWENADRFAGSPANTSSGTTTLVNPRATISACSDPELVAGRPFLDDCRWKTQNLLVRDNVFGLDRSVVPQCRAATGCGFNGLFSNYGTYPDWSPYQADVVARWIAFEQNNIWRDNTYRGPWSFIAPSQGDVLSPEQWRAEPFGQDAGSTFAAS